MHVHFFFLPFRVGKESNCCNVGLGLLMEKQVKIKNKFKRTKKIEMNIVNLVFPKIHRVRTEKF